MDGVEHGKHYSRRKSSRALERERKEESASQQIARAPAPAAALASSAHSLLGNALVQDSLNSPESGGLGAVLNEAMALGAAGVHVAADASSLFSNSYLNEWIEAHAPQSDAGMWAEGAGMSGGAAQSGAVARHARGAAMPAARDSRLQVIGQGGGSPLPSAVREKMEAAFGHDFGHVRIHTGASVARASDALNAHAFALGPHIYFGEGEFSPDSQRGAHLLAHELQHVVQADEGRLPSGGSSEAGGMQVSSPTDAHEIEAESVATAFAQGGEIASGAPELSAEVSQQPQQGSDTGVEDLASGTPSMSGASIARQEMQEEEAPAERPDIDTLLGEATESADASRTDRPAEDGTPVTDPTESVVEGDTKSGESEMVTAGEVGSPGEGKAAPGVPSAKATDTGGKAVAQPQAPALAAPDVGPAPATSGGNKSAPEVLSAAERVRGVADQQKAAILNEGEAQKGQVRAAGANQRAAVEGAIATLRGNILGSFAALATAIQSRGETALTTIRAQCDTEKTAINTLADTELRRMRDAVAARRGELDTLGKTLSSEAKAHGQLQASRALNETATKAQRATAIGEEKVGQYAKCKEASEIAKTARKMARETAAELIKQGAAIAAQCTKDGEALSAKIDADLAVLLKNLDGGIEPATAAIETARKTALKSCDTSRDDALRQVEKAVADALVGVGSGETTALAQVDGSADGVLRGIDAAVESDCLAIDAGVARANQQVEGAVAQVTAASAGVHGSRAAEALGMLSGIEAAVLETGAGAVYGLQSMGAQAVEAVNAGGADCVSQVLDAGEPIALQNDAVKAGFETSMGQIEACTLAAYTKAGSDARTAITAAAGGFITKLDEGFEEGKTKLTSLSTEGKAEIAKKVNDAVAKMEEAITTLGGEIDKRANEIENASWWDTLCTAVSGFFKGFFSQIWSWIKDILVALAIILVVLVVVILLVVILVAIFPSLLGPVLAGLIFLAVWGPTILAVIGYIGLAVGIILAAVSVYQCWKIWNNPNMTLGEKWEQVGRTVFDIIDAIGPEKFLKPIVGVFTGVKGLVGLSDAAKVDDVAKVSDVAKVDDLAKAGDAGKVADASRVDDAAKLSKGADGLGPSGKLWHDPKLTQADFVTDYRARYPRSKLTDAQLKAHFDAGKRLNPETGRLKKPTGAEGQSPGVAANESTSATTASVGKPSVFPTPEKQPFNKGEEAYNLTGSVADIKGGIEKIADPNKGTVLEGRDALVE